MTNKIPNVNFVFRIDSKYIEKNTDDLFRIKKSSYLPYQEHLHQPVRTTTSQAMKTNNR